MAVILLLIWMVLFITLNCEENLLLIFFVKLKCILRSKPFKNKFWVKSYRRPSFSILAHNVGNWIDWFLKSEIQTYCWPTWSLENVELLFVIGWSPSKHHISFHRLLYRYSSTRELWNRQNMLIQSFPKRLWMKLI